MDPTYPLFSIFAFLGFLLVLVPLPWHLEAWNSSTCYFMIWVAVSCLNQFVNSIVWADNAINVAPVWCDISTRIITAASIGIPAASLCINRRLYLIANVQAVTVTRAEKRKSVIIDTLICVFFPLLIVVLSYVVQGHRFNILSEVGCSNAFYNTLATYFLVSWWPLIIGLISAVYCVLSLLSFARRRAQFQQFLSSKSSTLSFSRYFRLMALACTELLLSVPLSTFIIYINLTAQPLGPWRSWSDTHLDFSRVDLVPSLLWRADHRVAVGVELSRWINPVCALIFFFYFGFAEEARRNYMKYWTWFSNRTIYRFISPPKSKTAAKRGLHLLQTPTSGSSGYFSEKSKALFSFSNITLPASPILPQYSPPSSSSPPILPPLAKFTSRPSSAISNASHQSLAQYVYVTSTTAHTSSPTTTSSHSNISPTISSVVSPFTPSTAQGAYSITMTELESLSSSRLGVDGFLASEFAESPAVSDGFPKSPSIRDEELGDPRRSFRAL